MTGTGTPARSAPRVGLGVTLCNRAEFLTEALESLLAQTYGNFQIVLVDDGSTDATETLARAYEQRDPRVRYVRLPARQGMVAAWRTAFEHASAGGVEYFAWGSDHDRWHPRWLEALVSVLDAHPEAVVAYPLTERISPEGAPLEKPARQFDTGDVADRRARWRLFNRSDAVAAGDIVYGLMRADAVRQAGVFRPVLCPDRLLLAELTLRGRIRQVPEVLWYRRQFAAGSIERQRSTLFAPGVAPPPAWMPPWLMHARSLRATYVDTDAHRPEGLSRDEARRLVTQYAAAYAWRHYAKSSVQRGVFAVLGWPRWLYKRVKHAVLLGVYGVLVMLRRLGVRRSHLWKVLFLARHFTYFRNYESVIAGLAARGHQVHLSAERAEDLGGEAMVDRLALAHDGVTVGWLPGRDDAWGRFLVGLRMTIDYLRYFDAAYRSTPKLRARAEDRVPRAGLWLATAMGASTALGRKILKAVLTACERAAPRSAAIDDYLRAQGPDVVLFTPLIGLSVSPQPDYLHSAQSLGYPTALCVWSWDHLSSKAILRRVPDRVFVWNETQREEAVSLHGVPPPRVIVTGAQCFDQWFDRQPSHNREAFCRAVGLPVDRPFLLYVCSALFQGSASEAVFVKDWIRALRSSGLEPLSSTPILVRPHPSRLRDWADVDLLTELNVRIAGRNPIDTEAKDEYFDSLYHSEAVVGLNTSAFLEAAVAGKAVFAPLLPEHYENQEGTIHFHYLMTSGGGLLHTARTLEEHGRQLNDALAAGTSESPRSRRFVEAFVRPRGVSVAATPVFVEAVEALGTVSVAPETTRVGTRLLRTILAPVVSFASSRVAEPLVLSHHERVLIERQRAHRERVDAAWRVKDALKVAERERKVARAAARARQKAERVAEWHRAKAAKR